MAGATLFSAPQPSHETLIAEVSSGARGELFCHRRQTDQLMVLRGAIDLIVLQAGSLRRITLREDEPTWVRIPPPGSSSSPGQPRCSATSSCQGRWDQVHAIRQRCSLLAKQPAWLTARASR